MKMIHIPQAIIIDFDRTLGDVDAAVKRLYKATTKCGIEINQIKKERTKVENDGGSFNALAYLQTELDQKKLEQFYDYYLADETPILYPDAREFLTQLDQAEIYYLVLTYGSNANWQMLKVRASGYKGPVSVVYHQEKGLAIAKHKQLSGEYHFVDQTNNITFVAINVCLIDDKAIAFHGLPSDAKGYMIKRSAELLKSQKGKLAKNVSIIQSLNDLIIKTDGTIGLKK